MSLQLANQFLRPEHARPQDDESPGPRDAQLVRTADHGTVGNVGVRAQTGLDLRRVDASAGTREGIVGRLLAE